MHTNPEATSAASAFRAFEEAYPGNQELPGHAFRLAYQRGDLEAARAAIAPLTEDPGLPAFTRADALFSLALASYREGRLDEGRAHALAAERVAGTVGGSYHVVERLWSAHVENVLGDPGWARSHVRAIVEDRSFETLEPRARPW